MKNEIPVINSDRLILRKFEENDSHYMFINWATDIECAKYTNMTVADNENNCKFIIDLWKKYYDKGLVMWAICLKASNEPIGMIGFELFENPEISFTIGKKYNNCGYATEALSSVLQFGIKNLGVKFFWGYHFTENIGSGRVMQKAGMVHTRSDVKLNKFFNKDMPIEIYEYRTE
ncbi:MAG: GNAT family N-acetyltransferase [Oscillospiraceae bacterium]|nr:GNAT family N-acetyltransferase [Oscillospiraceae bacterium]